MPTSGVHKGVTTRFASGSSGGNPMRTFHGYRMGGEVPVERFIRSRSGPRWPGRRASGPTAREPGRPVRRHALHAARSTLHPRSVGARFGDGRRARRTGRGGSAGPGPAGVPAGPARRMIPPSAFSLQEGDRRLLTSRHQVSECSRGD